MFFQKGLHNLFHRMKSAIDDYYYVDEIAVFKNNFKSFCEENKISNLMQYSIIRNNKHEAIIDQFIMTYIYKSLSQEQVNAIICQYGITKAMALLHDFHIIGMKCSHVDVCEYIMDPELKSEYLMVELIFLDAVEFHNNWRNN